MKKTKVVKLRVRPADPKPEWRKKQAAALKRRGVGKRAPKLPGVPEPLVKQLSAFLTPKQMTTLAKLHKAHIDALAVLEEPCVRSRGVIFTAEVLFRALSLMRICWRIFDTNGFSNNVSDLCGLLGQAVAQLIGGGAVEVKCGELHLKSEETEEAAPNETIH